jgi:DNA-binding CsgD family transcriptional regulator
VTTTARVETAWLDFVAELLAAPLRALPVGRIALQLATTSDSVACAFDLTGGDPPVRTIWQPAQGPRSHTLRRRSEWEAFYRAIGADHRLSIPLDVCTAFVLGRAEPYTVAEREFAGTVQRVLVGLHRQIGAGRTRPPRAAGVPLTRRETDVLAELATGLTAAAVGRRLGIAERTVHKHLERAYAKLGVSDRVSAVLRAQRLGLLD